MPSKNRVKIFLPNSVYHVYNRGVEKRDIYQGSQDYTFFLNSIKWYVLPREEVIQGLVSECKSPTILNSKLHSLARMPSYAGDVKILAFALIQNHFHILLKQTNTDGMSRFMSSLGIRYTMYFNRKNKRVGSLYQDIYKARLVKSKVDLLKTSKYIHRNSPHLTGSFESNPWSSLKYYGQEKAPKWIQTEEVLRAFAKSAHCGRHKNYFDYVKDQP